MYRYWSNKEVELISDPTLTDDQIAKQIGRTIGAIERKRREIDRGHYAEPIDDERYLYNPYAKLTKREKVQRILDLADKLEVKIVR